MMTIPSIDWAVGSILSAGENSVAVVTDAVVAPPVDVPTGTVCPEAETSQDVSCEIHEPSGLASLVRENVALGAVLRAIVHDFDRPVAARRVETAQPETMEEHALPRPEVSDDVPEVPAAVEKPSVPESEPVVVFDRPEAVSPEVPVAVEKPSVPEPEPVVVFDRPEAVPPEVPAAVEKPKAPVSEPMISERPLAVVPERLRNVRPQGMEAVEADEVVAPVALDRVPGVEPLVAALSPRVEADVAVVSPETVERVVRVSELMGLAPATPVEAAVPADQLVSAANEVASFILVTPSLMRGEAGEIRVQLRPDVLAGSEVVIAVDGRKMAVTFVPQTTAVADAVVTHTPQIVETLTARVAGFQFVVDVAQTVATNVAAAAQVAESSYRAPVRKFHERA